MRTIYERLANVFYDMDPEQSDNLPEYVSWLIDALKSVSSESEAAACYACTPLPEPFEAIYERSGATDPDAFRKDLEGACEAGIVMIIYLDRDNDVKGYYRAGLFPGLAENLATGRRVTREGAFWIDNYGKKYLNNNIIPNNVPYMGGFKSIAVREAIPAETKVAKYEEIDTCIQCGPCAESFILTGRGRSVTVDEVREILKRCEREGLVHNLMPMEKGKQDKLGGMIQH